MGGPPGLSGRDAGLAQPAPARDRRKDRLSDRRKVIRRSVSLQHSAISSQQTGREFSEAECYTKPSTLNVGTGLRNPFSTSGPTSSVSTRSSTAAFNREDTRI